MALTQPLHIHLSALPSMYATHTGSHKLPYPTRAFNLLDWDLIVNKLNILHDGVEWCVLIKLTWR